MAQPQAPSPSPLVTVITPTYNRTAFIEECVDSVLNQTFRDFEYVIACDGSPSDTLTMVGNFAARDSRVRPLQLPHRGIFPTVESAFRAARGSYVAVIPDDDLWENDYIATLLAYYNGDPTSQSYIYGDYDIFGADGPVKRCCPLENPYYLTGKSQGSFVNSLFSKIYLDQILAVRGSFFDNSSILGLHRGFRRHGDDELFVQLGLLRSPAHIHKVVSHYRYHTANYAKVPHLWIPFEKRVVAKRAGNPIPLKDTLYDFYFNAKLILKGP